jgi:hypothetical protein
MVAGNLKFPYRTKRIMKISTTAGRRGITFGLAHRAAVLAAHPISVICTAGHFAAIEANFVANFVARSYKRTIGGPGAVTKN